LEMLLGIPGEGAHTIPGLDPEAVKRCRQPFRPIGDGRVGGFSASARLASDDFAVGVKKSAVAENTAYGERKIHHRALHAEPPGDWLRFVHRNGWRFRAQGAGKRDAAISNVLTPCFSGACVRGND